MNPCGAAVDWIQFPFEVDARLLLGADAPLVRLRWLFTDQRFLPVGTNSVVNNRIWNEDQASDLVVGQVQPEIANYEQDDRWRLPAGMQPGHLCHPEWFATGEPYPSDLPPNVYGPNWIPECCGLFQDSTAGGMVIGGTVGDRYYPPDPTYGGMVIGGTVGDRYHTSDPTSGGMVIGGTVGDDYRPPDATAGGMEIGGECGDVYTAGSGQWIRDDCGEYFFTVEYTGLHRLNLYGAGGLGADATGGGGMGLSGGGGGGGAFSTLVAFLTLGDVWHVFVGCGHRDFKPNDSTTVIRQDDFILALADGGKDAVDNASGVGGQAADSIGDQVWSGGNGAIGGAMIEGGGGGSSACNSPTGIPPGTGTDGLGQLGGVAPLADGGDGGDGGDVPDGGEPGLHPGGGGGGAGSDAIDHGGDGSDGRIVITWPAV
jgi:hypothetical protein